MTTDGERFPVTRRHVLRSAGFVALAGFGFTSFAPAALAAANDKYPEDAFKQKDGKEAIRLLYGRTAEPSDKIRLDAPEIAENGNTVPFTIAVESPMTEADYVRAMHLISTGNPQPGVATFKFTPDSGKASVSSRMRLGQTQDVIVLAEMSDGRFLMAKRNVKVTIGGCGG